MATGQHLSAVGSVATGTGRSFASVGVQCFLLVGLLCCQFAVGACVDLVLESHDFEASLLSMDNYDASVAESEMELETVTPPVSRATHGIIGSPPHEPEALMQNDANATSLVLVHQSWWWTSKGRSQFDCIDVERANACVGLMAVCAQDT